MAKPKWGTKHTCPGCGIRFYDLKKDPAVCPSCDTVVIIQAPKMRKAVPVAKVVEKPAPEPVKPEKDSKEEEGGEALDAVVVEVEDDDDDDDNSLIEDTSELEEDDSMDEVKEHMETKKGDDS